ncbi:hypothetical protein BFJ63_vAg19283 [Fusarium oxysporum f. sp. narcissi]|uniref:Uncharacterized protein n=1 Tax=Fusarium oxysporum f. sp. narcissi TaxID=451672 RepID=A0A4Q2UV42_FUSOX|nr:hypothetical protein BFJ63_vAg19283 [Fusarium oxysporum f. sp. narcissi]
MRSSGYIASLVAAGAMAVHQNGKLQNDNKHYEIVTKFDYVTHYVIGGGSPTMVSLPINKRPLTFTTTPVKPWATALFLGMTHSPRVPSSGPITLLS